MIPMQLNTIAQLLGCKITGSGEDCRVDRIVSDSRKVQYGALFAALGGAQFDGHDFTQSAVEFGATALLVERPQPLDIPQLQVPDVLVALGRIAAYLRREIDPLVVGITGSNGKTTVKEMVAEILRNKGSVLQSVGNFNNELGVPLSLFDLEPYHDYAVLELGATKAGDIAYLADIVSPDIAVITNIGPAHLQGFGDEEGVARAKGEIFSALPENGWAVMNGDQPWTSLWRASSPAGNELTFGCNAGNDICVEINGDNGIFHTSAGEFEVGLALPGKHNLVNAAAATAVGIALEIPLADIKSALEQVKPVPGRLSRTRTEAGWTLIDDTYNANPASLYSALQVLSRMQGIAWLVMGDMKELGANSRKMHAEVGEAARALGINRIFATGEMCAHTVEAFGEGASHYPDKEAMIDDLVDGLRPGINCLIKGSRSMGMEQVVEAISGAGRDSNELREAG
jgi:UDP-N-acetylmuramoyl-tripeptide--D-alanyl-D-alanine ligase